MSLVIGAFRSGGVALELREGIAVLEQQGLGDAGIGSGWGLAEQGFKGGGFNAAQAGQAPAGFDHLLDEERFVLGLGVELGEGGSHEGFEGAPVFVGEERGGSGEAVRLGVPADSGFTGFATRAGTENRITAIGVDLGWGTHEGNSALRIADEGEKAARANSRNAGKWVRNQGETCLPIFVTGASGYQPLRERTRPPGRLIEAVQQLDSRP